MLLLLYVAPMRLSPKGILPVVTLVSSIAALSGYCWFRSMKAFAVALECIALALALVIPCLIATYLAASLDLPLADGRLANLDAALGFNWLAYIRFIDAHPELATVLNYSYRLFSYELLALLVILPLAGQFERTYVMVAAFAVLCLLSSLVSIWFPAVGTYTTYGIPAGAYPNIDSYYGFQFLKDFLAVREHPDFILSLDNISGIVTFPSDHAAAAVLCIWAAWGVKYIRIPFVVLNALMAASAIANANHYLIDVIAGVFVAIASILGVKATLERLACARRLDPVSHMPHATNQR